MQRAHNPAAPFAKYSNYIPKSLKFPKTLQIPKISKFKQTTRTIALFAKNQNLNKLSNQLNSQQNYNQNVFQTQNLMVVHNASKIIKFRNLGKQRERSLCSRKNQISTNHSNNLIPTKLFANSKFKGCMQRVQDPVTPFAVYFKMRTKVNQALL